MGESNVGQASGGEGADAKQPGPDVVWEGDPEKKAGKPKESGPDVVWEGGPEKKGGKPPASSG